MGENMILIRNTEVKQKSCELNLKQRMYQGKSIVTVQMMLEFFPIMIDEQIVSGALEVNIDATDIHSLNDLENKTYTGKVGKATLSVCNEGIWEHNNIYDLNVTFGKRNGNEISIKVAVEDCNCEMTTTIVSLYTVSSSEEKMNKNFFMEDFYEKPIKKEIGKNMILKYIVKGK